MAPRARIAGAVAALLLLALPASTAAQSPPFAPWDGANPFNCVEQDVGTGTDYPDPDADPFCVRFDKTNQNVTDFGIAEFAAQEPERIAAAGPKCFYFQHDEWTGSVVQGSQPEVWHWEGRYFFDKAKGIGGVSVVNFRVGGTPFDATPYVSPEYQPYFAEGGGGGVITTAETDPDPTCIAKVDSEEERATVYANLPDFGNCVAPGGKVRARKVGRARLGAPRAQVEQKVGAPERAEKRLDAWCVVGGGRLEILYVDERAALIHTTTPGHARAGLGPGDELAEAKDAVRLRRRPGFDRGGTKVFEAPRRHGRRLYAGVRDGIVNWLEMVEPQLIRSD